MKLKTPLILSILVILLISHIKVTYGVPNHFSNPGETGPCDVISYTTLINETVTEIYYPEDNSCIDGTLPPYPGIVFAHGFTFFGLTDGVKDNRGNGEHLASWGFVVALPKLPDDAESRISDVIEIIDYLESTYQEQPSSLFQLVNPERLAVVGHSLGGSTALAVTARDERIRVVVALDPVFHKGGPVGGQIVWDPYVEGPKILVPTGILGAPPDPCNAQADFQEIYPLIGANLKASFLLVDANHCAFNDPANPFCSYFCGGSLDPSKTELSQKYMTAWINYYLHQKVGYYPYLYGSYADDDIQAGLIVREVFTQPGLSFFPLVTR